MNYFFQYGFFALLILVSCKEKFDDNLSSSDINALVVEGEIDDGPGPYYVKLNRTASFNSSKIINESKALVYVVDELGRKIYYKETSPGFYYSDTTGFRARIGGVYTLFIDTKDSLSYKSEPCTIPPPSNIDSIFISEELYDGYKISGNMSFESNQKISTRIDADIAISNTYDTISILALTPYKIETHYVTTYFVTQHLNFMPVLKTNTDYNRGSKLTNIPLFTIHPPQQVRDTIKLDQNNFVAIAKGDYILIINIHSISNETFDYYSSMLGQTDNKDVFFEPTPIQLNGNIKCVNQKSKTVYGLFQANSIVKKYYNVGDNYYLSQVNEVPELIYYYYTTRQRILK